MEFPCFFDEIKGINQVSDRCHWYCEDYEQFVLDIYPDQFSFRSWSNEQPFYVKWDKGKIFRCVCNTKDETEFMYVHFQKRVMRISLNERNNNKPIYIVPNEFREDNNFKNSIMGQKLYKLKISIDRVKRVLNRLRSFGFVRFISYKKKVR